MSQAIPMSRMGNEAFNHSSNSDTEAQYDRLRDLARDEAKKRNTCIDRSREAYNRGDGAQAKELSNEGKAHAAKMDDFNRQASEFIFRENNAPGRVPEDAIDLHGQYVEEAVRILETRIRAAQASGQSHLHVIVGKGNHSYHHIGKIKPRVEQICQELGLEFETEENAGRILVKLGGAGGPSSYSAAGPSQQHHHQQQQGSHQSYHSGYSQQQQPLSPQSGYQQGYQQGYQPQQPPSQYGGDYPALGQPQQQQPPHHGQPQAHHQQQQQQQHGGSGGVPNRPDDKGDPIANFLSALFAKLRKSLCG